MKNLLLVIAIALVTFSSCSKSAIDAGNTTGTPGFAWQENGGTPIIADSAAYVFGIGGNSASYIYAYYHMGSSTSKMFEINLKGNTTTTFEIGANNSDFILFNGSNIAGGTAGKVIIASNSNGKATGSFDVTMSGGTITNIKGAFTDIKIRQ